MDDSFELTRRRALAALGTIGVASAGAGLGTSAYFSDQETFENNALTAGTLDMKVAATEYYSDWSPDEAELAGMADDEESTDIRLPPGDDQNDAQAIALDLDDEYDGGADDVYAAFFKTISSDADGTPYNRVNGGVSAASDGLCGTGSDADGPVIVDIEDVKPGDFGGAQFAFELCDNPGYVWLTGGLRDASENGVTEPEADDPDEEAGVVELLDEIQVAYGVGPINGDNSTFEDTDAGFQPVEQTTLREFLAMLDGGIALDGDIDAELGGGTGEQGCFGGGNPEEPSVHEVSVVWWLPIDHGNQVQSDSATFDLGFYTEQCRHNDGETALEAYYPFESSADDVSGNGYDGTISGDVSFTDGQIGWAAAFGGSDTRIAVDHDNETLAAQTAITVAAWVYPTDNDSGAYSGIVGSHQNSGPYHGWAVAQNRNGNLGLWSDRSGWSDTSLSLPLGEWTHIVVTRGESDSTATVYVNGSEATTTTWQIPSENDRPVFIGDRADSEGPPFDGAVDDVRIYSRTLSASEVQDLYDSA